MAIEAPDSQADSSSQTTVTKVDLSVVIPAYNEADRIAETIRVTVDELHKLGCGFELIIVDDGSKDRTYQRAEEIAKQHSELGRGEVRVIAYLQNGGKGYAVRYGAARTRGRFVAFMDADLDLHPRLLGRLIRIQADTNADIVIGSKRHPASIIDYPRERQLYSSVYSLLCRVLFDLPVRDTQTGIKLMRGVFARKVLAQLTVNRFAFDLEMLAVAHHLGLYIAEAPVELAFGRTFGRIGARDIMGICRDTMSVWWRLRFWRLDYSGAVEEPNLETI